jgi:hypothetical protein
MEKKNKKQKENQLKMEAATEFGATKNEKGNACRTEDGKRTCVSREESNGSRGNRT